MPDSSAIPAGSWPTIMTKKPKTWSARFVDAYGRLVASARIALVKPEGRINNGIYDVMVFLDTGEPNMSMVPPVTVAGTLIDAERAAERRIPSHTSIVHCNGWRLD